MNDKTQFTMAYLHYHPIASLRAYMMRLVLWLPSKKYSIAWKMVRNLAPRFSVFQ